VREVLVITLPTALTIETHTLERGWPCRVVDYSTGYARRFRTERDMLRWLTDNGYSLEVSRET
jgi:hypothetical protein